MPSGGPFEPEDVEAWRMRAEADLARLRSLTGARLGAEVMRRGFGDLPADRERTRIGLSNGLCPTAPPVVGGDDIDLVARYSGLLDPVLSALEDAGLVRGESRGRSALRFYRVTTRGRSALEDDDVETILAARSSATLAGLAREEFVSLTTYRRSGAAVSVPVWIAPATDASGGLLVTTTEPSGKVKRLRHDQRVQLRPCDRRGVIEADAPVVCARAEIVRAAADVRRLREAVRAKYGSRMKVTAADQGISDPAEPVRVILRITAADVDL